jgi:hypothetical protein
VRDQAIGGRFSGARDERANQPKAPDNPGRFDAL